MSLTKYKNIFKHFKFCVNLRIMSTFTHKLNPLIGKSSWVERCDDYDYHQEVANAGFGDMLHDTERNQKYYSTIRKTIAQMHDKGVKVNVLDIGTGTGILSMMAIKAGADTVTACETFLPMANCAERIFEANGYAGKVNLIKKRSTDIILGTDMPTRANLLVTEILDTELIGEGAINIYNHARKELLTDDVICIPASATCYVKLAESPLAAQWNTFKHLPNLDGDLLIKANEGIKNCFGSGGLHDLQLSQIPVEKLKYITFTIEIFTFDFSSKKPIEKQRKKNYIATSRREGMVDLVCFWWSLKMDLGGTIVLSCAPYSSHPEFPDYFDKNKDTGRPIQNVVPWRDHWLQAIYYIPKPLYIPQKNSGIWINCNHDEYSFWFDVYPAIQKNKEKADDCFQIEYEQLSSKDIVDRRGCSCGLHIAYSRSRIGQLNDAKRNKRYINALENFITKDSNVLVLSEGSILGLATAKFGATSITCFEKNPISKNFLMTLAKENEIENLKFITIIEELKDELESITHVFAEPHFLSTILPWDNLYFVILLSQIIDKLNPDVKIMPKSAHIKAMPVHFCDLHKIRKPVGTCEGFDLSHFDKMVEYSTDKAVSNVEAHPLWEYPCLPISQPQEICSIEIPYDMSKKTSSGNLILESNKTCNGITLWVDWHLDDSDDFKSIVSGGPTQPIDEEEYIEWDMFTRQGVHFVVKPIENTNQKIQLHWSVDFDLVNGKIDFNFKLSELSDEN